MANIHINVSLPTTFDTFCKSGTVICVFLLTRQYWKLWTLCLDYLWKWTRIYLFWTIVGIAHTLWCTLVQLLHYILKCIHLEWRWLFGPFRYMLIQTVWLIVQIISIPDEELFSETAVGCTVSYFVQIIWCSCWFWPPPLILRLTIAYFAVAEGWLLLDIGWFVLF